MLAVPPPLMAQPGPALPSWLGTYSGAEQDSGEAGWEHEWVGAGRGLVWQDRYIRVAWCLHCGYRALT